MFSLALLYSYAHRTVHLNSKCYLVYTLQHNEIKARVDEISVVNRRLLT
jgi:hypothetical protein